MIFPDFDILTLQLRETGDIVMNMKNWFDNLLAAEKKPALPLLSFPSVSLLGITVRELIADPRLQAAGMQAVAQRNASAAAVSMMDLSVEAEAFGSTIRTSDSEVPTVVGAIVTDAAEAEALAVPPVGAGRTGAYIRAIEEASALITDRPVFAGIIGPFSLAGRLVDVNEALILCYDDPDMLHTVLEKTTAFLIEYARAYRAAGANGVVMAEPLTGLLSPDLAEEFSEPYVRRVIEAVQTDDFAVIYHNCGNATIRQIDSILRVGAMGYHFGNSIDMAEMLTHIPADVPVMGNVDPVSQFYAGTPESMRAAVNDLLDACGSYPNFILSSGCDIPPGAKWENIDAFFAAARDYGN